MTTPTLIQGLFLIALLYVILSTISWASYHAEKGEGRMVLAWGAGAVAMCLLAIAGIIGAQG